MKKVIYFLIAILTFSIGFWLYNLRAFVTPVSLCDAIKNINIYRGHEIHLKGYLENVGQKDSDYPNIISLGTCITSVDGIFSVEGANLIFSEEQMKDENLSNLLEDLRVKNNELLEKKSEGWFMTEVEIVGELWDNRQSGIAGEGSDFSLKVKEIKQISETRFFPKSEILRLTGNKQKISN